MDDRNAICDHPGMDKEAEERATGALRRRIKAAFDNELVEFKDLSALVGMNETYIQQFVRNGSPKRMHPGMRTTLSEALDRAEAQAQPPSDQSGEVVELFPRKTLDAERMEIAMDLLRRTYGDEPVPVNVSMDILTDIYIRLGDENNSKRAVNNELVREELAKIKAKGEKWLTVLRGLRT